MKNAIQYKLSTANGPSGPDVGSLIVIGLGLLYYACMMAYLHHLFN